jgi:cytochrome c553
MKKLLSSILFAAVSFATGHALAQDLQGDAKAGEKKIAMCIGCHGIKGYQATFPEVYRVPMISGQNAKYISNALTSYRAGDRRHPTMRGIAASLTDQDIADISAYYAAHSQAAAAPEKAAEPTGKVAELVTKGACNSCHGANYSKGIDGSYPKLAGQNADYLYVALKSYKAENQGTWGRNNAIMGGVAKQFSNAELKELAKYMSAQTGELQVVPQSRFR